MSGAPGAAGATNAAGGEGGAATNGGGATSDAGQSGTGGAAPSCHSTRATTPVLPASTALDPDQVAIAAAVIGSCWPDDGVNRNATHLWHSNLAADRLYYRIATELSCVVNADCGCDAVEHCFGYEVGPTTSCVQGCNGAHFTGCGAGVGLPNGYGASFDCDSVGLACDPTAVCSEGSATTCVASTFTADCTADGRPEYCGDGVVWHGQACGDFGLACADGGCVGTGAGCGSGSSYPYDEVIGFEGVGCSGDVLEACVADKRATLDCATQGPGFSCQTHDGTFFCGLASECVPATDGSDSSLAASCNGSVLTFCNAGRIEHIDCPTLGFTGCDIDTSIGHYGCVSQ